MSVIWCLPRDILHSVYGEWLGWKDLSRLDIACVGKNERKEWLTSLTDLTNLRISLTFRSISDNKLMIFYKWLRSRNVFCVEEFLIRLDVIEDLVTILDMESYCPVLRSIVIETCSDIVKSSDKMYLSILLSHCHNLQEVALCMRDFDNDVVLPVLIEKLRENSLVKISLHNLKRHHESNMMITDFLTKHASSLRVLCISTLFEVNVDFIVSTLIKNQICLRELTIIFGGKAFQGMSSLISYISSSGGLLEVLDVFSVKRSFNAEDLVASVATSCPKLTRLLTFDCKPCNIETLRRLYEQCPHLQYVSIGDVDKVIETDEKRKSVSIEVKGRNEDWAICLSHGLRRGKYKKVTLLLREDYNHPVGNLKSMLEPYEIELKASTTSESSLISLLQDLPHLNSLHLVPNVDNQYTDATLAVISKHVNSLTALKSIDVSDTLLSELIKTCQLLERLTIEYCGWESLVAISKLSNLNMVELSMCESASEEMLEGLLLDENVTWPSTLKEGSIKVIGCRIPYKFNNKSHHWIR